MTTAWNKLNFQWKVISVAPPPSPNPKNQHHTKITPPQAKQQQQQKQQQEETKKQFKTSENEQVPVTDVSAWQFGASPPPPPTFCFLTRHLQFLIIAAVVNTCTNSILFHITQEQKMPEGTFKTGPQTQGRAAQQLDRQQQQLTLANTSHMSPHRLLALNHS